MVETIDVERPIAGSRAGAAAPDRVVTHDALEFVADLHRSIEPAREHLLSRREMRLAEFHQGDLPGFRDATLPIREDNTWKVAPAPADLQDRRAEVTRPAEPPKVIEPLQPGAGA